MAVKEGSWRTENWDPQNLNAGFKYDPTNYNPADYQAFKEARAARDKENLAKAREQLAEVQKAAADAVAETIRDALEAAAENGARLDWNGKSTCFSELSWEDGVVDATFTNGYSYSAEMDVADFLDWMSDDSIGGYYNEVLGQDFFAPKKDKGK